MADIQSKGLDFDVLTRLVVDLGSLKDSNDKALGAIRALQAYLAGCGITTSELLRLLTTDHYEERIQALERENTRLINEQGLPPPQKPTEVRSQTPPRSAGRPGPKLGYVKYLWQNYEIEMAKKLKDRGYTYAQITQQMREEFPRPFTENSVQALFNKKLKNQK